MEVVLLQDAAIRTRVQRRVVEGLIQLWPQSKLLTFPQQRGSDLSRADLIVSTSLSAATMIDDRSKAAHLCYLSDGCAPSSRLPRGWTSTLDRYDSNDEESLVPRGRNSATIRDARWRPAQIPTFVFRSHAAARSAGWPRPEIIPPPVPTDIFRPAETHLRDGYLVSCETSWNDNTAAAVEACRLGRCRVRISGRVAESIRNRYRDDPQIEWLGDIRDAELATVVAASRGVIVPHANDCDLLSYEAQACGIPVIVFRESGVAASIIDTEVYGLGTGICFDEPTAESIWSAILELERRPHLCSPAAGWTNAARCSQERFEDRIREIANRAMTYASLTLSPEGRPVIGRFPSEQESPERDFTPPIRKAA